MQSREAQLKKRNQVICDETLATTLQRTRVEQLAREKRQVRGSQSSQHESSMHCQCDAMMEKHRATSPANAAVLTPMTRAEQLAAKKETGAWFSVLPATTANGRNSPQKSFETRCQCDVMMQKRRATSPTSMTIVMPVSPFSVRLEARKEVS